MSDKFWCELCTMRDWVYEDKDSIEKERPVCRYVESFKTIKKAEDELSQAIESNDYQNLDKILTQI